MGWFDKLFKKERKVIADTPIVVQEANDPVEIQQPAPVEPDLQDEAFADESQYVTDDELATLLAEQGVMSEEGVLGRDAFVDWDAGRVA
jgi:hypothetical protein